MYCLQGWGQRGKLEELEKCSDMVFLERNIPEPRALTIEVFVILDGCQGLGSPDGSGWLFLDRADMVQGVKERERVVAVDERTK